MRNNIVLSKLSELENNPKKFEIYVPSKPLTYSDKDKWTYS
jgi:hypothetical protein